MASVLLAIEAERLERQKKIVLQRRRSSWAARPPPWAAQQQKARPPKGDLFSARHERARRASFEQGSGVDLRPEVEISCAPYGFQSKRLRRSRGHLNNHFMARFVSSYFIIIMIIVYRNAGGETPRGGGHGGGRSFSLSHVLIIARTLARSLSSSTVKGAKEAQSSLGCNIGRD